MSDHKCVDFPDIDEHLAPRAFLFADSGSYLAGVAEAVAAMDEIVHRRELAEVPPITEPEAETAPSAA